MKVSFVTPCFNSRDYIAKALESVMRQSYADWELVIVDDGSDDGSLDICREYVAGDDRIRIIEAEHSGCAYIPRKRAIEEARGEFIAPIDSDDWLDEDYLRILLEKQKESGAEIVYPVMYSVRDGMVRRSVPSEEFTGDTLYTGRELIGETLPWWRISAGGGIISREAYMRTFRLYENSYIDVRNIFADELLTRCLFYTVTKISFAEAPYYYQDNRQSVTHGIRARMAYLEHLRRLTRLLETESGKESEDARLARLRTVLNVFDVCRVIAAIDGNKVERPADWNEKRRVLTGMLDESRRNTSLYGLHKEIGRGYRMLYRIGIGAILAWLPWVDKIRRNEPGE